MTSQKLFRIVPSHFLTVLLAILLALSAASCGPTGSLPENTAFSIYGQATYHTSQTAVSRYPTGYPLAGTQYLLEEGRIIHLAAHMTGFATIDLTRQAPSSVNCPTGTQNFAFSVDLAQDVAVDAQGFYRASVDLPNLRADFGNGCVASLLHVASVDLFVMNATIDYDSSSCLNEGFGRILAQCESDCADSSNFSCTDSCPWTYVPGLQHACAHAESTKRAGLAPLISANVTLDAVDLLNLADSPDHAFYSQLDFSTN